MSKTLRTVGAQRVTLDIDGTVVSTGLQVAWARRGYNPHHRKVPSYYPKLAHVAQTGQILAVKNCPGNVSDGKYAQHFLRDVVRQVRAELGSVVVEWRLDGAFFQRPVLATLEQLGVEYALKVLITLSACETGLGGPIGLSRALMAAGARAVIASLWKVDDAATADLMEYFYRNLLTGQSPAAALQAGHSCRCRGACGIQAIGEDLQ